jgi:hypothetical protein
MGQKDPVKLYTTDNLVGRDPHEYIFVVLEKLRGWGEIEIDPCSRREYFHLNLM